MSSGRVFKVSVHCPRGILDFVLELALACPQDAFLGRHRMCPWGARECGLWLFWGVFSSCHGVGSQAIVCIFFLGCVQRVLECVPSECILGVSLRCRWGVLVCVQECVLGMCSLGILGYLGACPRSMSSGCLRGVLEVSWCVSSGRLSRSRDPLGVHLRNTYNVSSVCPGMCPWVASFRKLSSGCVLGVLRSFAFGYSAVCSQGVMGLAPRLLCAFP